MTNPVFFASTPELAGLKAGDTFILGGPEGHHARTVKRLGPGEPVDIVDGAGLRVSGHLLDDGDGLPVAVTTVRQEPAHSPSLVLVQALAKGGRDELAIEAATELGIDAVVPWQADRSIVRWKMDKAEKGRTKWQTTVRAAAKQARRARVPEVHPCLGSAGLVDMTSEANVALILHEDADSSIASLLDDPAVAVVMGGHQPGTEELQAAGNSENDASAKPLSVLLIVGPEGGISGQETAALTAAGAVAVRLGPHVLRSSTAGPAAISVLNHLLGRWD